MSTSSRRLLRAKKPTQTIQESAYAAYSFNAGSGTTVADETGHGHTLSLTSGNTWSVGHTGNGLAVDGTIAGAYGTAHPGTAFTVMAWVKFTNTTGWQSIVEIPSGDKLFLEANNGVLDAFVTGTTGATAQSSTTLTSDTWYHVAVTASATTVTLYADGVSIATGSGAPGPFAAWSADTVYFGGSPINRFNGVIDDARIFDTVLTQTEIQSWMNTPVGGSTTPPPDPNPTPDPSSVTFTPTAIPLSDPEIPNSGRGQVEWLGTGPDPAGWPLVDTYRRNPWEVNWRTIETSPGVYDFKMIDDLIAEAVAMGGRLHFRFMTWFHPENPTHLVPDYVPLQPKILFNGVLTETYLPDWDSEAYLGGWERLWQAVAAKYNNDPRVMYVDIGGVGAWSEWFFETAWGSWPSQASAARICDAVINSMTNKYIISPAPALVPGSDPGINYGFRYAVSKSDRVGWRFDNIGAQAVDLSGGFWTQREVDTWQRAPVIGEWGPGVNTGLPLTYVDQGDLNRQQMHLAMLSSSNKPNYAYGPAGEYNYLRSTTMSPADQTTYSNIMKTIGFRLSLTSAVMQTGLARGSSMQVTTTWQNDGVTPVYDPWVTQLVLMSGTSIIWQQSLSNVVLKSILPGSKQFTSTVTLPNQAGTFTAGILITDPANYLPPLRLATTGRTSAGVYPLGTITIV